MSKKEPCKSDFFVNLFSRGHLNILEKIIFNLPPRTLIWCQDINEDWKQIIKFFLASKNPKILKIRDIRLREEWGLKGPIIHSVSLDSFGIFHVKCFQMINDEVDVVAAANVNETRKCKVIVFDAQTASVRHVLYLKNFDGDDDGDFDVLEVKMSMDRKFLVAYVHQDPEVRFYLVWKRTENYLATSQIRECDREWCQILRPHLQNVPFLVDGSLLIFRREFIDDAGRHVVEYDNWNLEEDVSSKKEFIIANDILPGTWYKHRDGKGIVETFISVSAENKTKHLTTLIDGKRHDQNLDSKIEAAFVIGHSTNSFATMLICTLDMKYFQFFEFKTGMLQRVGVREWR